MRSVNGQGPEAQLGHYHGEAQPLTHFPDENRITDVGSSLEGEAEVLDEGPVMLPPHALFPQALQGKLQPFVLVIAWEEAWILIPPDPRGPWY